METWWLDDAEALHAAAPDSFFIPPAAKRRSLEAGDRVKLIFRFAPPVDGMDGERMWVEVTTVGDGYEGVLLNEPRHMTSIAAGARVRFGPEHVASYDWEPAELGYDPDLAAWTRKDGSRPRRVSMRPPELRAADGDSGWILGRGDERSEEYTDEALFGWSGLGWLTDRFPELELVFRAGGGDWRWDEEAGEYVRAG